MGSALGGADGQPSGGTAGGRIPPLLAAAFASGGEMGAHIRDFDWSTTSLGPFERWPASLRSAVAMMLASRSQIAMFWGPNYKVFYNDAYRPTIGAKHPAALGGRARDHWSEMWDEVLAPLFDGVRATGVAYQGRDHPFLLSRYGFLEEVYFDISYDPLRGEDGEVHGLYCIVTETTERVLGERRLRALTELGTRLTEATSDADLGRLTAEVLGAHQADIPFVLCYLTGPAGPRLVGAAGVAAPDVRLDGSGQLPAVLLGALTEGAAGEADPAEFLHRIPPLAGERALVLPVTVATEPVGALVLGRSSRLGFTDEYRDFFDMLANQVSVAVSRMRAYEQERDRAAQLAALDRAKTSFFANVSHEFRTPLTLLLGPLEDALAAGGLPPEVRAQVEMMHRNALRLLKLVNTVLDFSHLESGRIEAHYVPTDLAAYTAELASTFRSAAERVGLRFVVDCPPLPEPVHVDRDMWEKIVLNLLSNAVKFTFHGEIAVRLRARQGAAELEIQDSGVGMAPTELPHIFERFHRGAGARSRSHEGTGIGLALVRELAELHGGRASVRSEPGQGSTFTVSVPFGTRHLPAERVAAVPTGSAGDDDTSRLYLGETAWWIGQEAEAVLPGRPAQVTGRTGRVLVVDDNADLRAYLIRLLAPYWEVVAAPDGAAALDAAVAEPFDLVLSDVMMPRLDGFGLVSALRGDARTRHVPIVLLSARAGSTEEVAGLAAGADDYLVKPFSAQELLARVRANVELGQLRGQIIQQLRALADAAVELNTARSTTEVLRVAARHALDLVHASRVVVTAPDERYEADGGGRGAPEPLVLPLTGTTDGPLGELRVWARQGQPGTDAEQNALSQLARLVGVRLENARLYEAEHRVATTLQHSLLPRSTPRLPGAVVATRYLPGTAEVEVGGDWYDVIPVGEDEMVLVIGDVVGKGVAAAAAMGQLRNALRAYVLEGFDPGASLTRLNRLVGSTEQQPFATLVCLWFNSRTGRLRYASAGHPSPLVIRDGGVGFLHRGALGPPVGAFSQAEFVTVEDHLAPGGRLLLYTDGLVEDRSHGIDTGLSQLRTNAATVCAHVEDLVDAVVAPVARRPRRDDVAVLALEATELNRFVLEFAADPTQLTVLRRRLEDFLVAHRVGEADRFDLTVAISEAAANAIEHPVAPAEARIGVEVTVDDGTVVATVRDSGQWREPTDAGFRGRGLALISALGELAVNRTSSGTEVTLRRQLQRS